MSDDDRKRVRELLKRVVLIDFNDWAALTEIVERNQNDGIFTEEERPALFPLEVLGVDAVAAHEPPLPAAP